MQQTSDFHSRLDTIAENKSVFGSYLSLLAIELNNNTGIPDRFIQGYNSVCMTAPTDKALPYCEYHFPTYYMITQLLQNYSVQQKQDPYCCMKFTKRSRRKKRIQYQSRRLICTMMHGRLKDPNFGTILA